MSDRDKILFLDDDKDRHTAFYSRMLALGHNQKYNIIQVFTAKEAIQELDNGGVFMAFLDHDLSDEDMMVEVGYPTKVPTGMTVVDHIVTMEDPPKEIVVHSMNYDASVEMAKRLADTRKIIVKRVPFHTLIAAITKGSDV